MLRSLNQRSVRAVGLLLALMLVLGVAMAPAAVSAAPAASAPAASASVAPSLATSSEAIYAPARTGGGYCANRYYVRRGDTLSGIAARFGVSTRALAAANNIYNPSRIYAGQWLCIPSGYGGYYPPKPPGHGYYPPKPPDHGYYPPKPPDHGYYPPKPPDHGYYPPKPPGHGYYPSQPSYGYGHGCGQYYVVQRGDNLSRIAARCGTSVHNLVYLNGIRNPSIIYVGWTLRIY